VPQIAFCHWGQAFKIQNRKPRSEVLANTLFLRKFRYKEETTTGLSSEIYINAQKVSTKD
jgi:hypothetical protein